MGAHLAFASMDVKISTVDTDVHVPPDLHKITTTISVLVSKEKRLK